MISGKVIRLNRIGDAEIVFLEGSISIVDEEGHEERFDPGDCFFLEKGFIHSRIAIWLCRPR